MTTAFTVQPFQGIDQAHRLSSFLQECHGGAWQPSVYHIGDVWWHLALDRDGRISGWSDATGTLLGFAWMEGPDIVLMHIRPDLHGQGELEEAMLAWAIGDQPIEQLSTRAFDSDTATKAWLLNNGFANDSFVMILHRRDMALPIPETTLPPGFVVRHVQPDELEERVEAHRDAFHPSKLTLEKYAFARATPGYDPELDIVAVASDGTIAAYCIAWYDPANRIGYFEPVGTRAAFRRLHLGQAVLNEALRRLHARGAREAIVATNEDNTSARQLYQSVGLVDADTERGYVKTLNR